MPPGLKEIVQLFQGLPEADRREMLTAFAEQAGAHEPQEEEIFQVEEVRTDAECTDEVGIFLQVGQNSTVRFRVRLGPEVQTLTRALGAILCQGLEGVRVDEISGVSSEFIAEIVGGKLVRLRSQTVYYLLDRMKEAAGRYLEMVEIKDS